MGHASHHPEAYGPQNQEEWAQEQAAQDDAEAAARAWRWATAPMPPQSYASPRALRAALDRAQGDWAQVLSPAQLDQALPPEQWGGHATLRTWLADGATRHNAAQVWPLVRTA